MCLVGLNRIEAMPDASSSAYSRNGFQCALAEGFSSRAESMARNEAARNWLPVSVALAKAAIDPPSEPFDSLGTRTGQPPTP